MYAVSREVDFFRWPPRASILGDFYCEAIVLKEAGFFPHIWTLQYREGLWNLWPRVTPGGDYFLIGGWLPEYEVERDTGDTSEGEP